MEINELSNLLDQFKADAISKFEKGRKEHGQDFEKIAYDDEMYGEIIDLLMYLLLRRKYDKKEVSNL